MGRTVYKRVMTEDGGIVQVSLYDYPDGYQTDDDYKALTAGAGYLVTSSLRTVGYYMTLSEVAQAIVRDRGLGVPEVQDPCGELVGWEGDEGQPCGRPRGHKPTRGQVIGGHAYLPLDFDAPTKRYRKRIVWDVVEP